ncbi:MAG: hypothetical protein HY866_02555 [Chloroflexi bacterium]|nr:hypothetical protein [Chloroflexota bacterium]
MRRFLVLALIAGVVLAGGVYSNFAAAQGTLDGRVLVWESTPDDDGQVEVLTSAGVAEVLTDFQPGVFGNWAKRCSQDYWAAGGQGVVLFSGAEQGSIAVYPLAGGAPVSLGTANRMACAGPASFQLSPNGQRAGYIDYLPDMDEVYREFPYGNLVFVDAATGTQQATFDWAISFALYDDGALMLRLFPDGKGNATEADLDWWDGSSRRTLTTLEPVYPPDTQDVDCGIKSASVVRVGDTAYVLVGQWCETGASNWRLVSVPLAGGSATQIAFEQSAGGFFPESFSTQLIPTRDGTGFVVAVPSGLARNTVYLSWVTLAGQITPIMEGTHVIADKYGERLSEGRHMLVSTDGNTLGFVSATGNNEQTLWLLDLSVPGGTPVIAEEQGTNQRIFQFVWSASGRLYFISGSIESNSLKVIAPGGESQRIARGRFFQLAVTYLGDKIAASEWFENPASIGDDLFRLTLLDQSGNTVVLKEGGVEHNQIIPLAIQ